MRGRPRKFTAQGELDVVARLQAGEPVNTLAKELSVSRQTILRIRKRHVPRGESQVHNQTSEATS